MVILCLLADVNVMNYGKKGLSEGWYCVFISNCFTWNIWICEWNVVASVIAGICCIGRVPSATAETCFIGCRPFGYRRNMFHLIELLLV